jgi:protein involved in polysaccharide export with SLBB domain
MRDAGTLRVWFGTMLLMCIGCFLPVVAAQEKPGQTQSDYVIGPGDTLEIQVQNHPEFFAEAVMVRPDGYIRLPMLHEEQDFGLGTNDVRAAGLTVGELRSRLSHKLQLEVAVVVKQKESCRVFSSAPGGRQRTSLVTGCFDVASGAYHISAGDVLQIDVWKQPQVTRTLPVRPDGTIYLPLVDGVNVAGLTAMELAGLLREKLLPFLENPQVTVTVVRTRGTSAPTMPPARPILPQRSPQMDTPPTKCCVA